MTHAWSTDPGRDAAVRAAEDGRQGALPTLEEAIGEVFPTKAASEWRILKVGEVVEAGDEMTDDLFMPWRDASPCIGEEVARGPIGFRRRITAQAASGGNHSANPNGSEQEPVAWGFFAEDGGMVHVSTFKPEPGTATVVPLYRLPSPPRGWLTGKERTTLAGVVGLLRDLAKVCGRAAASRCELTAVAVEALLARSTPPEVVLKDFPPDTIRSVDSHYLAGWDQCMALAKKALAAAGVTVNEVGT